MKKDIILIVEDHEDIQAIYKDMVGDKYDLIQVISAEDAQKVLGKQKVDLMILDIILPKQSGDTFLVYLKQKNKFKDLKVICITVLGDVSKQLQKIDPKVKCIPKPFKKNELLEVIEAELKRV